jgi:hypothetical protein
MKEHTHKLPAFGFANATALKPVAPVRMRGWRDFHSRRSCRERFAETEKARVAW